MELPIPPQAGANITLHHRTHQVGFTGSRPPPSATALLSATTPESAIAPWRGRRCGASAAGCTADGRLGQPRASVFQEPGVAMNKTPLSRSCPCRRTRSTIHQSFSLRGGHLRAPAAISAGDIARAKTKPQAWEQTERGGSPEDQGRRRASVPPHCRCGVWPQREGPTTLSRQMDPRPQGPDGPRPCARARERARDEGDCGGHDKRQMRQR